MVFGCLEALNIGRNVLSKLIEESFSPQPLWRLPAGEKRKGLTPPGKAIDAAASLGVTPVGCTASGKSSTSALHEDTGGRPEGPAATLARLSPVAGPPARVAESSRRCSSCLANSVGFCSALSGFAIVLERALRPVSDEKRAVHSGVSDPQQHASPSRFVARARCACTETAGAVGSAAGVSFTRVSHERESALHMTV